MKYKLLHNSTSNNWVDIILNNRGIVNTSSYLHTTDEDINSYEGFGLDKLEAGLKMLIKNIYDEKDAIIVVDSDCDGYTSAALLINYLYKVFPVWSCQHLFYTMHEGKQHGLSDFNFDLLGQLNLGIVICPDSSSNDQEYHKKLVDECVDVLVLDHHEADIDINNQDAIIINNQLSNYPNKDLSGVGVTWQFCRYFDSRAGYNFADEYLDLVALGNMADMMSLKSIETKHLINKGFEPENIKNPFINGMWEKNKFKLGEHITPMGAAFYIAPFVNAMVRSGTEEEKDLLFKSMLYNEAYKKIPSNKRGHKLGEEEYLVDQALRTCTNVKNRQTRAQDAGLEFLEDKIEKENLLKNKVLLFLLEPGQIDRNIAGLIANKFMAKYQRPCCVLIKVVDNDKVSYQGSARGYDKSGITNFKDICAGCYTTIYAEGHPSAFGLGIDVIDDKGECAGEGIYQFIDYTNEALKDMSSEPMYYVDGIWTIDDIDTDAIIEIAELENLWGKDMDEPLFLLKDIKVTKDMVFMMKSNTLKIVLPNNISIIKFNCPDEEYEQLLTEGYVKIDMIVKCNKNEWNGNVYPQFILEDLEIKETALWDF